MKRVILLGMIFLFFGSLVNAQCLDVDEDGYGVYNDATCRETGIDCDDTDLGTYPGANELCDFLDNDCDGLIDEDNGCAPVCGNGDCDGTETSETCELDCGPVVSYCGDSTCDQDESCDNCETDCGACPVDFGSCEVVDADWFDLSGTSLDYANEGDTVRLIANIEDPGNPVSNCENLPLTFAIFEIDGVDAEGYPTYDSSVIENVVYVENGKAVFDWDVVYDENEPDATTYNDDANPEYVLTGIFYDGSGQEVSYSIPERYFVIFPSDYNPETDEIDNDLNQNGLPSTDAENDLASCGNLFCRGDEDTNSCPEDCPQVDSCGDGICGSSETYQDCFDDCQAENPFFGCSLNSVDWKNLDGDFIEPEDPDGSLVAISEGKTINLVADVSGCEGKSLTFKIYEIDFDENYEIMDNMEEIVSLKSTISNDLAVTEWISAFVEEDADGVSGLNPDYLLVATLEEEGSDPFEMLYDEDILIVYPVDGTTDDINSTYAIDEDYVDEVYEQSKQSTLSSSVSYKSETQAMPQLYKSKEKKEEICGDGFCSENENEEVCPEDCLEVAGGIAATIFFVIVIIFVLGSVGFFLYKKFVVKKKFIKKVQEQEKVFGAQKPEIKPFQQPQSQQPQSQQQPVQSQVQQPQSQQQSVQPQVPTENLVNPFSNNQLLERTINFIKTAKTQGLTDDKIKEMLKNGNYSQEQIDYAFSQNL